MRDVGPTPTMKRRRRWSFFMRPLEHWPMLILDDLHRGWLTPFGRVLFWGAIAAGMLLLGGIASPLVHAFGYCVSALVLAGLAGWFYRPRLRMTRQITTFPTVGEVFRYRVTVENVGVRVARNVLVEERNLPLELRPVEDAPSIESLAPGETVSVTLELRCERRGVYELTRLQGATAYPSGLFKVGAVTRQFDRLLVLPRVTPLEGFELPHGRNYQPGGIAEASRVGESTEFLGTRPWRSGDRLRDIHWRSTARAGQLVVKEFQEEYFVRIAVVLDVEARTAHDERYLERAIALAASVTASLARQDFIVDVFAAGASVHHLQAGRSLAHVANILELLACVEAGDRLDRAELEAALAPNLRQLSAVMLVLTDWNAARAELVEWLKSWGLAVRVMVARPVSKPRELASEEFIEVPT